MAPGCGGVQRRVRVLIEDVWRCAYGSNAVPVSVRQRGEGLYARSELYGPDSTSSRTRSKLPLEAAVQMFSIVAGAGTMRL